MKLLQISDVLPNNESGGSIVLKRHIEAFDGEVVVWKGTLQRTFPSKLAHKLLTVLGLDTFKKSILPKIDNFKISKQLLEQSREADAILTVAHRRTCFLAQKVAERVGKPLITIFHDYYPATECTIESKRNALETEFSSLYKASALCFMVSKGLYQKMGSHKNAYVLYPLPKLAHGKAEKTLVLDNIKLLYTGNAKGKYRQFLNEFIDALNQVPSINLSVYGSSTEWIIANEQIEVGGFIPEDAYQNTLLSADVLLLLIPDDAEEKLHYSTQFPSKFIDYANSGKAIMVFAEKDTSIARFLNDENPKGVALFHPKEVNKALLWLKDNAIALQNDAQQRTLIPEFQPDYIINTFNTEVHKLCKS